MPSCKKGGGGDPRSFKKTPLRKGELLPEELEGKEEAVFGEQSSSGCTLLAEDILLVPPEE
jgi:hypothetical protein